MTNFLFKPLKRKFFCILSGETRKRNFIFNTSQLETLYDAYWAFVFGNATKVTVLSSKTKKVVKVFNSIDDWKDFWSTKYGEANYMVWHDQVKVR